MVCSTDGADVGGVEGASEGTAVGRDDAAAAGIDVGADMAYATASESAKFTYKGTPNDDPSFTVSTVWKKVGGAWKLAHGHRSTATGNDMSSWEGCV